MGRDYEDLFDLDDLNDDELQALIHEELAESPDIDAANILVRVKDGLVHLSGRTGTEAERRIAEHVVSDMVGVERYENHIVVDPVYREQAPDAADEAVVDEPDEDTLGARDDRFSASEGAHMEEDPTGRLYGTTDRARRSRRGCPGHPPTCRRPKGWATTNPKTPRTAKRTDVIHSGTQPCLSSP